ncbi:hypothetical protein [Roseixanthobacter glucoisosaccharinicivorans]|uniref:hypothetical protein n=1 Tax=Roseixanthobacter glucoisosaccharinicivorans TaxID=3119923 RepID=UPI0037286349
MNKLSFPLLALGAAVLFAGAARADEYEAALNRENYSVAAQSAASVSEMRGADTALAYGAVAAPHIATYVFAQPETRALSQKDALFLAQGDRGIGNN